MIHLNSENLTANLFLPRNHVSNNPLYSLASNVLLLAVIDLAEVLNEQPAKYSRSRLDTLDFFLDHKSLPFKFWCSVVEANPTTARSKILNFLEVSEDSLLECRSEVVSKCKRKVKNINTVGFYD